MCPKSPCLCVGLAIWKCSKNLMKCRQGLTWLRSRCTSLRRKFQGHNPPSPLPITVLYVNINACSSEGILWEKTSETLLSTSLTSVRQPVESAGKQFNSLSDWGLLLWTCRQGTDKRQYFIEMTNKMQLCRTIYYSIVRWTLNILLVISIRFGIMMHGSMNVMTIFGITSNDYLLRFVSL